MSEQGYEIPGVGDAPQPAKGRKGKAKTPGPFVDPKVEDCPVIPLGYQGRDVVFALPGGELRYEAAKNIAGMLKSDIFVCVAGHTFLSQWVDDDGEFKAQAASTWFVRACRDAGRWDTNRPIRGYGVWTSTKGPIVHAGDALGRWPFAKDDWTPIAAALRAGGSGPVWRLAPPTPRPGKAATLEDARTLKAHLERWRWHSLGSDGDPEGGLTGIDVVLGWQGMALLGAAAPFRAHILMLGGFGTGKTTLSRLMQAAGSANAGDLLDRFTEAGIRGDVSGEARAVYLDEAEPSEDGPGPVEKALDMLRRMATGDGSKGVQGGMNGQTVSQTAIGAAWLGAILSVGLNDAMTSRIVEVRLRPLDKAKGGADAELDAAIEWAKATSPRFLARAMRDYARYRSDVSMMKTALGEAGQLPRGADLVAALAAGRRLLLNEEPLSLEDARHELTLWAPLIQTREQTSSTVNPGQACLSAIMALHSHQHVRDRFLTLGEMVQEEAASPGTHDKVLKTFGLRIENNPPGHAHPGPWLLVANVHPSLAKALEKTRFKNWRSALEHLGDLGDAYRPRTLGYAPKFGIGIQSRALAIPLTPWLERPVGVGVDRSAPSPFDPPTWHSRMAAASPDSSPSASPGESHD